jgi:hypothetical protein
VHLAGVVVARALGIIADAHHGDGHVRRDHRPGVLQSPVRVEDLRPDGADALEGREGREQGLEPSFGGLGVVVQEDEVSAACCAGAAIARQHEAAVLRVAEVAQVLDERQERRGVVRRRVVDDDELVIVRWSVRSHGGDARQRLAHVIERGDHDRDARHLDGREMGAARECG